VVVVVVVVVVVILVVVILVVVILVVVHRTQAKKHLLKHPSSEGLDSEEQLLAGVAQVVADVSSRPLPPGAGQPAH
jgi:heme/copper-type cytochrome/quinol oxidase subunit 2